KVFRSVRVVSARGEQVHVSIIGLLSTSELIEEAMQAGDLDWLRGQVDEAVDLARDEGAAVVGFGGLLSVVTHNCKKALVHDLALTTGNALTVAMGLQAIERGAEQRGIVLAEARIGIIGAAGNIGSTYARLIAERVCDLLLAGRA